MDNMIKISELQKAYPIVNDDVFVVNQENKASKVLETRYTTAQDISKYISESLAVLLDKFIPVGTIKLYAGDISQYDKLDGWLLCNGQYVSRVKYKKLYNLIGGIYGDSSAESFALPNFVGRVPLGYCGTNKEPITLKNPQDKVVLGSTGGTYEHILTESELASHNHTDAGHKHRHFDISRTPTFRNDNTGGDNCWRNNGPEKQIYDKIKKDLEVASEYYSLSKTSNANIQNTGGNMPHNNVQPYLAVHYIIKY